MFFGAGNLGDDLMVAGFLAGLGAAPELRLTCATAYHVESQRRRFPRIEWSAYTPATRDALIAECDIWLGLGGAVLQPLNDAWLLADQAIQLQECQRRGTPVFFLGCGIDDRADGQRPEIQLLLESARWIWTRDPLSTLSLERLGHRRMTTGADLAHLALRAAPPPPAAAAGTGFLCNFEVPGQYSIERLAQLIATVPDRPIPWLVQEVRPLPGSELDLLARLPPETARRLEQRRPDYLAADLAALVQSWGASDGGMPRQLFSTRFHGAILGAWAGSRVVVFERQQKLRGIAQALGLISFAALPEPAQLTRAFEAAQPVARPALDAAAELAQQCCTEFLAQARDAALAAKAARLGAKPDTAAPVTVERHSPAGMADAGIERLAPGLKRGEIFVVRNCLQAIGALAPLRAMILDAIEEISGPAARAKAMAQGLTRLHDFIPIHQLMQLNPLMKQRARLLAARIVADLTALLRLGPDIHFEDTPNVRIFMPQDASAEHDAALKAYAKRRGSGGELTLHPPHQDSRHFHPVGALNVWCAIDRVVEANAMSVFPEFYGHHLPFTAADGGILPGQYLGAPVTMDLAPGDAWIFETLHLHGSTINQTDDTRFVISFRLTADTPRYPVKPWYNYVRPRDCTAAGPPPNRVDYRGGPPDRGPVTLDTATRLPPAVAAVPLDDGKVGVPAGMVPEGQIRPINAELCVARNGGKPVAFHRSCPHEGADLAGGSIRNGQIVCPWHGLRMNADTGLSACRSLPALALVACTEEDGVIVIDPAVAVRPAEQAAPDEFSEGIRRFTDSAEAFRTLCQALGETPDPATLLRLAHARDAAIYALLNLPGAVVKARLERPVGALLTALFDSGIRHLPRSAEQQAAFAECCRRLGQSWGDDAGYVYGVAALALSWHGSELIGLRPLAQDLGWAERFWLDCLLATPPSFLWPGDADRFAQTLAPLMEQILERLDTAPPDSRTALLKALLTSGLYVQGYFTEHSMRPAMVARARVLERLLALEGARPDQLVPRRPIRQRPRVGFIAPAIQDRTESVFLLAHMEHLAAQGFEVRLYSRSDPEGRIGMLCRNAAHRYRRLPESLLADAALLRGEDLDIAVFASNLAATATSCTLLAAQRIARIQVMATWTPVTSGFRHVDVMISGEYGEPPGAESSYTERLVRLPGSHACFPFQRMLEGQSATTNPGRAALGIPDAAPVYASIAFGAKILPELFTTWTKILAQVPDAYLILMPFNPNWSKSFDRQALLRRIVVQWQDSGLSVARLRVLNPVPTIADVHQVLGLCDIYLDSFPYSGACSIFDPIAVGLPIVARAGRTCRSRQSYAMLREAGFEDWVAPDEQHYVERAVRLGRDPDFLADDAVRLAERTAEGPLFGDTARYAVKLGTALKGLVADWNRRTDSLLALPEGPRAQRLAEHGLRFSALRARFSALDLLEEVVLPYLRHGGTRQFVHLGQGFDQAARAPLEEGWHGLSLDPDGKPTSGPDSGSTAGTIEAAGFNDADLVVIDAGGNDFALLGTLNFGALTPGLIMTAFHPALPGQDPVTAGTLLAGMRLNGYRAAVFSFALDAATRQPRLAGLSLDHVPDRPFGGVILFFRTTDEAFLSSLLGWLEDESEAAAPMQGSLAAE
jgi:predicted O-linked N-acetylglucosamine transferase (SPINDLY family)/nitrite reductase/ring-hydroxylating ferredoxin subunit